MWPYAHLDVAGGTGDVAFRILDQFRAERDGQADRHVTVLDINGDMLRVGQERAVKRFGDDPRIDFVQGNAEALPFENGRFDSLTIAFGIRNVPRIPVALSEFYRVLKIGGRFLCLEFAPVNMPGLDKIYDAFSFHVIPPIGKMVTGDAQPYQYLVESIRKFPVPAAFSADDRAGGLSPGHPSRHHRRRGEHSLRLEIVSVLLTAPLHLARLARVGFVLAREGALGIADTPALPPAMRPFLKIARLIERKNATGSRLAAAMTRLGPSYVKFGQFLATRPDIVGMTVARESGNIAGPRARLSHGASKGCDCSGF